MEGKDKVAVGWGEVSIAKWSWSNCDLIDYYFRSVLWGLTGASRDGCLPGSLLELQVNWGLGP
jgi:hypothetical protein